jgi:hypothetical protein
MQTTRDLQTMSSILEEAIRQELPDLEWRCDKYSDGQSWVVASTERPDRQLEVMIWPDLDIQVNWHTSGKLGSPFELLFVVDDMNLTQVCIEVASLVSDLVSERTVIVMKKGLFSGGRAFINPMKLAEIKPRKLKWIESWRGTYDRL